MPAVSTKHRRVHDRRGEPEGHDGRERHPHGQKRGDQRDHPAGAEGRDAARQRAQPDHQDRRAGEGLGDQVVGAGSRSPRRQSRSTGIRKGRGVQGGGQRVLLRTPRLSAACGASKHRQRRKDQRRGEPDTLGPARDGAARTGGPVSEGLCQSSPNLRNCSCFRARKRLHRSYRRILRRAGPKHRRNTREVQESRRRLCIVGKSTRLNTSRPCLSCTTSPASTSVDR